VLEKQPDNADALLMLGGAMAALGIVDEGIAATRRAIALDPQRAGRYFNLGALQYQKGDKAEAEETFIKAVELDPKNLIPRIGLADFYAVENRNAEAERVYKEALALDPVNLRANRAIASFYIRSGKLRDAENHLVRVAETSRTKDDWYALVDYYTAVRRRAPALKILHQLRAERANYAEASVKLAFLATLDRHHKQAMDLVDQVISREPEYAPAYALKAHLLLAARKWPDAFAVAEKAVNVDRKSEAAHLAYGVTAAAVGRRDMAKDGFLEVLKLNPSSAEALMELANLYVGVSSVDTALGYAEQAVRSHPHLLEARLMRLHVLARHSERRAEAAQEMKALLAAFPDAPEVQFEAGVVALGRGDAAEAGRYFTRARELAPGYTRALIELIKLDLKANRLPQAKRRVDEALSKDPESVDLLVVAGTTYAMLNDPAGSERHLRAALRADSSNITAYHALAALYLSRNQFDHARAEFIKLTQQEPHAVAPPTLLGLLAQAHGKFPEAENWYKQALKIEPRAAVAANNLAWLYAERGEHLELALDLAQMARSELPKHSEVTDTLGWVYLKKGMPDRAVRTLQDAIGQDATKALYHYHLGLAYAQLGEDARAGISIKHALTLDPNFSKAADAQRALQKLLY
jgi:tetratricopeptide (TPR) repeat protein